jgi:DNA adenine methylase
LPELLRRVPAEYGTYHEPFLGGGAMFFALAPRRAVLSDANADLVIAYLMVKTKLRDLVSALRDLKRGHLSGGLEHYLQIRKDDPSFPIERAARFIYLNKTCFNGLYRVNKQGEFNVPMGKWKKLPEICDEENLSACQAILRGDVDVGIRDFRTSLLIPGRGDFVYLDPPYAPTSSTSDFTSYTKEGFGPADQKQLAEMMRALKERGVKILLSNAGTQDVRDLYPEPLFKVEEVAALRRVNSKGGKRGAVVELLIS